MPQALLQRTGNVGLQQGQSVHCARGRSIRLPKM
jgi:hypothetical protein